MLGQVETGMKAKGKNDIMNEKATIRKLRLTNERQLQCNNKTALKKKSNENYFGLMFMNRKS